MGLFVAKLVGLPQPFYYVFTPYYPFGLIGHSASPLSLPIHSLGFPNPFTSSLPLIIPIGLLHSSGLLGPFTHSLPLFIFVGLLAINPAASAPWACFLISLPFYPSFPSHLLYYWASSVVGPFVKNGHKKISFKTQKKLISYSTTWIGLVAHKILTLSIKLVKTRLHEVCW